MAMLINTLGLGRKILKQAFIVESDNYPDWTDVLLGNKFNTTQSFERFKSMIGLGAAALTDEGETVPVDDWGNLFTRDFTPVMYTKAIQMSEQMEYTNQYKAVLDLTPQLAAAFALRRGKVAAAVYNSGFTDTTMGMNSEALFTTSHSNGTNTGTNRPATDIALGPLAVAQCRKEMSKALSPRGEPMFHDGAIKILVPEDLWGTAYALGASENQIGSNINDKNFAKVGFTYEHSPYLTSTTAWFARYENNAHHNLFMLSQIPYKMQQLPVNMQLMNTWVAYETYVAGWKAWQGTWGTTG